jgi:hypothetical protein
MTGKKKNMDGGQLLSLLPKKPIITQEHNAHLNKIRNLYKIYDRINPSQISVNNLNMKVKSLNQFSKIIENNSSLQPLFEQIKLKLIEITKLSLSEFKSAKFVHDNNIDFAELLNRLKEFYKLLNLLKLLDNQFNLSVYNPSESSFINKILIQYEDHIQYILYRNPNIDILQQLYQEVQNYITEYSEFIESMTNNRKRNNPISEIIHRLKSISDQISIKISSLSSNINGNQLSNAMKRRRNILYDTNKYQKSINYNNTLRKLHGRYRKNPNDYNLKELSSLAEIGSKIKSISRISSMNKNNKNILLRDLRETIKRLKNSLNKYPEFQEYENYIESISAQ